MDLSEQRFRVGTKELADKEARAYGVPHPIHPSFGSFGMLRHGRLSPHAHHHNNRLRARLN